MLLEKASDLSLEGPDYNEGARFLELLDAACDFTFQTFDDKKGRKDRELVRELHGTLPEHILTLTQLNEAGAGIFVTVNKTDMLGRRTENIACVRTVFQDDDARFAGTYPLEPSIVVETSQGKAQRYWLADGLSFEEFDGVMARLVQDFGADPNAKDLARVLRLPGFYHRKAEPHLVRIVGGNGRRYGRGEILYAFPPLARSKRAGVAAVGDIELDQRANIEAAREYLTKRAPLAIEGRGGDTTTYRVCCVVRDYALFEGTALSLLWEDWNPRCIPPWTWDELEEKVRRALAYGRGQIGSRTPEGMLPAVVAVPQPEATQRAPVASTAMKRGLITRNLAEVSNEPIEWLWPNMLARGKFNLLAGAPGLGKSQLLIQIAAILSVGRKWPTGEDCKRGGVLFVQGEDGIGDTIGPRFDAAAGDRSRFEIMNLVEDVDSSGQPVKRVFHLDTDLHLIEAWFRDHPDFDTLMIDPVAAYLGKADSHKDAEVRAVLTPLADLAQALNLTIIGIAHLNKSSGSQGASGRISGSAAYVQVPRIVLMVAQDPDNPDLSVIQLHKKNICKKSPGLSYGIESIVLPHPKYPRGIETSRIAWKGQKTIDLDEALDTAGRQRKTSSMDEASIWLKDYLKDGPKAMWDIEEAAKGAGLSWNSVRAAKKALGVVSEKGRGDTLSPWKWRLPVDHPAWLSALMPPPPYGKMQ